MLEFVDSTLFPADCPPREAKSGNQTFFRLSKSNPPIEDVDFKTQKAKGIKPKAGYTECHTCGLSIWASLERCLEMARQPWVSESNDVFTCEIHLINSKFQNLKSQIEL